MSIQLPIKIFILVSLLTMIAESPAFAQQEIEKWFLEQDLVSPSQLKKYTDKKVNKDEYARLMLKLMKKEKGGRKYVRQAKKEYRQEMQMKKPKTDTLSILADILEFSPKKEYVLAEPDLQTDSSTKKNIFRRNTNDPAEKLSLTSYALQLNRKGFINESSFKTLADHITNEKITDSCSLVRNAMGLRDKAIATAKPKLVELMNLLKDLNVLSKQKHEQLVNASFPDSVNKVFQIVSNCEHVVFLPKKNSFVNGKEDFDQLIGLLSKLTGIAVSDPLVKSIGLSDNEQYYRSFAVIELYHNGKKFIHEENESMSAKKDPDPYMLYHQNIYQLFNKILASKNSPYRVHEIQEHNPSFYIYFGWSGYILLNKSQSKALYHNENIDLSYEENISPLTEANIIKATELYKKAGLLNKVTQSDIDSVLNNIKENPVFRYNELISRFPDISIYTDDRFRPSEEELVDQIKKLAELSDYHFDPKNIRIVKNNPGKSQILFELNNQTFTNDLDPWINAWRIVHHPTYTVLKENPFQPLRIAQHKQIIIYLPSKNMKMLEKEEVIGDW